MLSQTAIRRAASDEDFAVLGQLMRDYEAELQVDLCFQDFAAELANIRGAYDVALLGECADGPVGCIALKRHNETRCEMKRLYVRPGHRKGGLGRRLAEDIVREAKARDYKEMVLDTLERLAPAIALYEDMGFRRCAPYYKNPEADVVYMSMGL